MPAPPSATQPTSSIVRNADACASAIASSFSMSISGALQIVNATKNSRLKATAADEREHCLRARADLAQARVEAGHEPRGQDQRRKAEDRGGDHPGVVAAGEADDFGGRLAGLAACRRECERDRSDHEQQASERRPPLEPGRAGARGGGNSDGNVGCGQRVSFRAAGWGSGILRSGPDRV
jgi:hypothetical protein